MNNQYGHLASLVYQTDKPIGVSFGDIEYYLARLAPVTGSILEPAVGNGRFLVPLLNAGKKVIGYDSSPDMLAFAQRALKQEGLSAELSLARFETFETTQCFDAIVIPAGSFQLISSFSTAQHVLNAFYQQLADNGRLLFDLDAARLIFNPQANVRKWTLQDNQIITLQSTPLSIDYLQQTAVELHRYELWHNGQLEQTELEEFSLRWWNPTEITMALQLAGFKDITISGGYHYGKAPTNDDSILNIEARK